MSDTMNSQYWRQLAITSVKDPGQAARTLMAMGLKPDFLWTALVLVAVGNTFLFTLSNVILPGPSPLPELFSIPWVYFAIVAGGLALSALSIFWTGRLMGGKGTLADILVLVVWMQTLRVLVQVVVLVLVFVLPLLSALLVFAAALIGVYMLVHFIKEAHRFDSTGRAAFVLIASLVAIVIGLSLLLTLVGGFTVGSTLNV